MSEGDRESPLVIDPDENLGQQLAAARALLAAPAGETGAAAARELARLVLELSDWLEHGGSLPAAWHGIAADDGGDDAEPTIADLDGRYGPGPEDA